MRPFERAGPFLHSPCSRKVAIHCVAGKRLGLKIDHVPESWLLACHAGRTSLSSSMVRPTTGPLAVRNQPRVSRAVSESARELRPALRAGVVSRVAKPAKSGKGSHRIRERELPLWSRINAGGDDSATYVGRSELPGRRVAAVAVSILQDDADSRGC